MCKHDQCIWENYVVLFYKLLFVSFYYKDDDDCDNNLCQNGAECVDGDNSYTCSCAFGFQGLKCESR